MSLKSIFIPISLILIFFRSNANNIEYTPLTDLQNEVSIQAKIDKYQKVEITLTKNNENELNIVVPAGYLLDSENEKRQDLLVINKTQFTFKSRELKISVKGYCCQASKGGPRLDDKYIVRGYHPNTKLVSLAKFLDTNNGYKSGIQHAIWVLSDNKNIAGIGNRSTGRKLRQVVAKIGNIDTSWYNSKDHGWYSLDYYESTDTNSYFSDNHKHLRGEISYYLSDKRLISIVVKDMNKQIVKVLEDGYKSQGKHTYDIKLNISKWPKGQYELFIYEDHGRYLEKYKIRI